MGAKDLLRQLEENDARDRLRHGLAIHPLKSKLVRGAVCIIEDEAINFPHARLPDAGEATIHSGRFGILVQLTSLCQSDAMVTVLVVPCTASFTGKPGPTDFLIPDGESGFTKKGIIALVGLVQPVLKSEIKEIKGNLQPDTLGKLMGMLNATLGGQ